jgi:hypothetical protein
LQFPSKEQWASLCASDAPRTRLFTPQGQALYVDVRSGDLRHDENGAAEENLFFIAEPSSREDAAWGWLACRSGEDWRPVVCAARRSGLPIDAAAWTAPTPLEAVRLERGLIALTANSLFLCADGDKSVTLSRPACSAWECFLPTNESCFGGAMRSDLKYVRGRVEYLDAVGVSQTVIHPMARVKSASSTKKTKIVFFGPLQWSNGRVYYDLCKHLHESGYIADILNYREVHGHYIEHIKTYYDIFVAGLEDAMHVLVDIYGINFDQIIGVSHWTYDIQAFIERYGRDAFNRLAGYGVVGNTLLWDSLTLGVTRLPKVASLGVNFDEFYSEIPERLVTVGCASSLSAKNRYGVEIKRGRLAQESAEGAGLDFRAAGFWTERYTQIHEMPNYYRSVDAVLVPSLTEAGGPMPATEAAAAGRLVISTPVGVFPYRAYKGLGIMAPIEMEQYKNFVIDTLLYYKEHKFEYIETCRRAQAAAEQFDWRYVISEWIELIEDALKRR